MEQIELDQLGSKIDALIDSYERVHEENISLRTQLNVLEHEHYQLKEKNALISKRINDMLTRLKSIESTPQ